MNPAEENFEADLPRTKLMCADNWQPASSNLMKINVDTNKRRAKRAVSPEREKTSRNKDPSARSGFICRPSAAEGKLI